MPENGFLPLILLFLFGGFAVLSAALKARARVMALPAIALAVLEGISGMVLMGVALPTSGSLETASRMGILTAVLVALSSTIHLLKVRERNRMREASEGKRLYAAIKYGIDGSPSILADELPEAGERPEADELSEGAGPSGVDGSP
jgi:hypothetical protein